MIRRDQFHQLLFPYCLVMAYLTDSHVLRGCLSGSMRAPIVQAYVCTCVYGLKHRRATVWVCEKKFGTVQVWR